MSFNATLANIRDGELNSLLTEKLNDLVDAVQSTGRSGHLTLKIIVKANGEDAVTLEPSVTLKVPETPVGSALFFVAGGNLVRRNPKQMDFEDELAVKRAEKEN